jgi:hypothetical protein
MTHSGAASLVTTSKQSSMNAGLSAREMKNSCIKDKDNDFTFVVGSRRYDCPRSATEFLSPHVCQCRSGDDTFKEMRISTEDPNDILGSLMSIG